MKQSAKRLLSFVLCLAMLVGLFPAVAIGANAAETVIDAAIFCSDVHGSSSDLTSVLGGFKTSGVDYSAIGFVGDTCLTVANTTSIVQSALGDTEIEVMFSYSASHDTENSADISTNWNYSGEVEGVSENYLVYTIRETDMQTSSAAATAAPAFTTWYNGLTAAQKALPIFIMSHRPLHDRRDDNAGAAAWYSAISAAAETSDIVFFWAHNHTSESDVDIAAYYVAKNGDETFTVYNGDTVTPNFTYMNAGYINANNQNPARIGVATTVQITADSLIFQDYNSSGEYTGTYAHNVTVAREFASSTDSGDGDGSTDETTAPTEGEDEETTTTTTYNYTATATADGTTGYILVSDGYALQNNNGTISAVAVTVSDDGSTITFDSSVDVSTILWAIDSDGDVMNDGYYLLRQSGSGEKSMTISTTDSGDAYSNWTYSSDTLTTTGGSGGSTTFYAYCTDGTFYTQSSSSQELKFYVPTTGGSTEDGEDDTTGGSTDTAYGEGTYTTAEDGSYQKVTFGTAGEKKTVYVLVSTPTAGNDYIIASSNSAGSAYALKENTTTGTSVTINAASGNITAPYIEASDNTIVWTAASGMTFQSKNGGYYLRQSNSGGSRSLSFSTSQSTDWTVAANTLSYEGRNSTYYVSGGSTWSLSSHSANVYFYQAQEIDTSTEVTYSVTAEDIKHVFDDDTTNTETATIEASVDSAISGGTYSYTIVSDESGIISGEIASDGTITFTGAEGTATVKVAYTFTKNDVEYTIWDTITVTASDPYYTLDLHKANYTYTEVSITEFAEGVTYLTKNEDGTYSVAESYVEGTTYYTYSATIGDEITAPIAIKGVEAGDRYGVWAVIKYYDGTTEDGSEVGDVADGDIVWTSSDESIATVEPYTGIITFTGKEGTVNITATYQKGNKPSDTITISVSPNKYSLPADGTSDFPEYPNEGAIRFDKTATAVGNFSETGIAQVELSMTGVPYTTGSEIDVVIMLDMTGSMSTTAMTAAEESAIAFAEQIVKNEDGTYNSNRIAILAFNSSDSSPFTYWSLDTVDSDTEWSSLCTAVRKASEDQTSGGTPYDEALAKCQDILTAAKKDGTGNDRQQFCVFVSDGGPTSYEYITNYDEVKAGTATAYTTSSASATGGSNQSDSNFATIATYTHEYYSTLMKDDGVTMFSVLTGLSADDYPNCATILKNIASSSDNAYVVEDGSDTSALTDALGDIAVKIMQAATDVTVEDKITDEYTMIFGIPTGSVTIGGEGSDLEGQEFYIEFLKYTLDSNHERVDSDNDGDTYDDATSVTKLYLGTSNGTYFAASDANGTAYDAPVFAQSTIGDKGTLYYWTTDSSYASKAAVTCTNSDNTYYFIPYGMEANEDGTAPDGWYNMTSGAYASGTIDSTTNMSTDLVIATPYFVYNAGTKMLYWTVDKLDTAEYALRYFLYLDESATEVGTDNETEAGTYPTNEHAYITYTNFNGNACQQQFPVPQLTWNGAQVSYVFYLVNAAGQPINKSGQVVDFANATFITDIYTTAVVWNKGSDGQIEGDANLSIDWLAANLLPSDYLLYDTEAEYELKVYADASGNDIFNYFTIGGSTAADISSSLNTRLSLSTTESTVSVETTKVYNTKAGTKYDDYGTYASKSADGVDTVLSSFDFSNTTVAFAVVWQPKLVPDTVVVDYGLDVVINVVQNDILQNTVTGIGLGNDAFSDTTMNTGVYNVNQEKGRLGTAALTTTDGSTISIENENQIRFSQNDMTFEAPTTFYYESPVSFYENSEQQTGYMYSSVTVIPATTIYYEDDFLSYETSGTAEWVDVGTASEDQTQDQDRPGTSQISTALDSDNNYGYDSAYTECSLYSLGTAKKVTVSSGNAGRASFTFYGTGFDVISLTDKDTGTIVVKVYSVEGDTKTLTKDLVVDTYYGYEQDEDGNWVLTENNPNALYQVPVMTVDDLTYGKYYVTITASYQEIYDNVDDEANSYDFYMDAIRIYDPCGTDVAVDDDTTVGDIYAQDGEGWPQYIELRNNIIEASNYTVTENEDGTVTVSGTNLSGAIFIDSSDATTSIADYVSYGPNNELYLASGQSVSFALDQAYASILADVQIAMKLGNGSSVSYEIYNAASDGTKSNTMTGTLTTATDLYYSIKDLASGTIVISNTSGGILSITNIKVTYAQNPYGTSTSSEEDLDSGIMTTSLYVDEEVATAAVMSLRSVPVVEEPEVEETEPETTVPEETEPEVTEPENTEPEETEPETTEPQETEPETTEPGETEGSDSGSSDEDSGNVLVEIIKKLLGWLFG